MARAAWVHSVVGPTGSNVSRLGDVDHCALEDRAGKQTLGARIRQNLRVQFGVRRPCALTVLGGDGQVTGEGHVLVLV